MLGEQPAEQRSEHAGGAEDGTEQALVAAAFAGRYEVADDRHGQHHEPASAEALERAEGDELAHVLRGAAERRADEEDRDGRLEQLLAPVLVAQLAPQRGGGGGGEEIGGDDPGEVLQAAEVADDRGQGGGDDRLVEGGEEHAEEEGTDGDEDAAAGLGGGTLTPRVHSSRTAAVPEHVLGHETSRRLPSCSV